MNKPLIVFISGIILMQTCIAYGTLSNSADKKEETIKILSYNVRNCRGMDNITSYQRIADVITRTAPDFVALQELDSANCEK